MKIIKRPTIQALRQCRFRPIHAARNEEDATRIGVDLGPHRISAHGRDRRQLRRGVGADAVSELLGGKGQGIRIATGGREQESSREKEKERLHGGGGVLFVAVLTRSHRLSRRYKRNFGLFSSNFACPPGRDCQFCEFWVVTDR